MEPEAIFVECDEDGFWLNITEAEIGTTAYRISDPEAFYDHVKTAIGPWLYERDEARRTLHNAEAWHTVAEDLRGAYDTSDPKHPDFHSVHADLYDSREGK